MKIILKHLALEKKKDLIERNIEAMYIDLYNTFYFVAEFCGTYGYLAPETLKCCMYENMPGYGREVDL